MRCNFKVEVTDPEEFTSEYMSDKVRKSTIVDEQDVDGDTAVKSLTFTFHDYMLALHDEQNEVNRMKAGILPSSPQACSPTYKQWSVNDLVELVHNPKEEMNWAIFGPTDELEKGIVKAVYVFGHTDNITSAYSIDELTIAKADSCTSHIDASCVQRPGVLTREIIKKSTHEKYFLRIYLKNRQKSLNVITNEAEVMKMLDHPSAIKLMEIFEDEQQVCLVLTHAAGQNLLDAVTGSSGFNERVAANVFAQVIDFVRYIHSENICHRDLTADEMFFLEDRDATYNLENGILQVIDFHNACMCVEDQKFTIQPTPTKPVYTAPEVHENKYDRSVDLWSCGVLMHFLLTGAPPFRGITQVEVRNSVRVGKMQQLVGVSDDARDLLQRLLKREPYQRISAQAACEHIWVRDKAPNAKETGGINLSSLAANAQEYQAHNSLVQIARRFVARSLNSNEIQHLGEILAMCDVDGNGYLTAEELKQGLLSSGFTDVPLDLLDIVEKSPMGLDYTDFIATTLQQKIFDEDADCWAAFKTFDSDGDGMISNDEIETVLSSPDLEKILGEPAAAASREVMRDHDFSNDGGIDFTEFMAMMRSGS